VALKKQTPADRNHTHICKRRTRVLPLLAIFASNHITHDCVPIFRYTASIENLVIQYRLAFTSMLMHTRAAFGERAINAIVSFYLYRSLDVKQRYNDAIALIACFPNKDTHTHAHRRIR